MPERGKPFDARPRVIPATIRLSRLASRSNEDLIACGDDIPTCEACLEEQPFGNAWSLDMGAGVNLVTHHICDPCKRAGPFA